MAQTPKTVLIVDDDERVRDSMAAVLKRDYRVLRVGTGEAALTVLGKDDVDLVLAGVVQDGAQLVLAAIFRNEVVGAVFHGLHRRFDFGCR